MGCAPAYQKSLGPLPNGNTLPLVTGDNVMQLTVNGSTCSANTYFNKPCVSVTVCVPGTTHCQTVQDILVDTGSVGLRIFKSALSIPLVTGTLGECVQFADGSADWGPVVNADVVLGNEPTVQTPIQLIDSSFGKTPKACGHPESSPAEAQLNGILGVGLFAEDCGPACANQRGNSIYYSCNGNRCEGTAVPLASQVQNPVALLPSDNNGVLIRLPSIGESGQNSANGYLILGIGTRENNTPGQVTSYPVDPGTGTFFTNWNGNQVSAFLDTGSNTYAFDSNLPDCGDDDPRASGWLCPDSTTVLSANTMGFNGSPKTSVDFEIANFLKIDTSNNVFMNVGVGLASDFFDWGLPFHLGRNVYVGFESKSSSLGSGTYWAY